MAFCPECGKSATAEASKCVHCGFDFGAKNKPAEKARFKGTMMMAAPVTSAPTPEPAPGPTAPAAAAAPAGSVVPKPGLKATMVGGAIAVPPPASGEEARKKLAFAATQPLAAAPNIEPKSEIKVAPQQVLGTPPAPEKKYLPGDPMAPTPAARPRSQSKQIARLEERAEKNPLFLVWLALGGMLVIGAVGYAAASYMGLV